MLIVTGAYPPNATSGGPTRSLEAIAEIIRDHLDVHVLASAREADGRLIEGVQPDRWLDRRGVSVRYSSSSAFRRCLEVVPAILEHRRGTISVVSAHDPVSVWAILVATAAGAKRVVVSPRGEFSPGALQYGRRRKLALRWVLRVLSRSPTLRWHATSALEAAHTRTWIGAHASIEVVRPTRFDIPLRLTGGGRDPAVPTVGFVSRISPKKNLAGLLAALGTSDRPYRLEVYGNADDLAYLRDCQAAADRVARSNSRADIRFNGPVAPSKIGAVLERLDLLALPTFGENFGHVILEALAASTPVLIGRDTPWSDVESWGAGYVCDPHDGDDIAAKLERFMDASPEARRRQRQRARSFAAGALGTAEDAAATVALFEP